MKNILGMLALAGTLTAASSSFAASYYAGVGIVNNEVEEIDLRSVEGIFGINQNDYIAWEARVGFGLGSTSETNYESGEDGFDAVASNDFKISNTVGLFVKPQYSVEHAKFYGLLGYSKIKIKADNLSLTVNGEKVDLTEWDEYQGSISDSDSGATFGFGAGLLFESHTINLEWRRAMLDEIDVDSLSVSYLYSF